MMGHVQPPINKRPDTAYPIDDRGTTPWPYWRRVLAVWLCVLALFIGHALAQSADTAAPDLKKIKTLLTQLDQYLTLLETQIKTSTAQSERYLAYADAERDPDRQAKYEQLHQEFATRADELSRERDGVVAKHDQAKAYLDKLLEKPKDGD